MPDRKQISTTGYPPEARVRLGQAVAKARIAAGYKFRTDFARAAGVKSQRSLQMLEQGDEYVGQVILFAVARALPNWNEDTPRTILEGGPIPPTVQETAQEAAQETAPTASVADIPGLGQLRDGVEVQLWAIKELDEETRKAYIFQHRARVAQERAI
ncbi:hypothetical protein ORV05_04675 [Amycolatopsis cynarae]|uniref:Helix-turn-helix transcriptional regulator n=1 Tax=Amycolatopsis cynarae TaxID=2995223 RepID=A0ABY7B567_9PSEU|nr:hypothetical protein [Amycolatopsis sp. HUAS 11-8]WAL67085.1 hypothetical protein ORV05_04675 [Amycolatopsis sp. HUAS 11-8]